MTEYVEQPQRQKAVTRAQIKAARLRRAILEDTGNPVDALTERIAAIAVPGASMHTSDVAPSKRTPSKGHAETGFSVSRDAARGKFKSITRRDGRIGAGQQVVGSHGDHLIKTADRSGSSSRSRAIAADGVDVGSVKEIYLDDRTGEATWAVVALDKPWGQSAFVPLVDHVEDEDSTKGWSFAFPSEVIKKSQTVAVTDHLDQDQERKLYEYYGLDELPS